MTNHIAGKSIVITGGGGGFGRLVAQKATALGARVTCGDIDLAAAQATADAIICVIDQPWGVSISEVTVRTSGDHFVL